MLKFIATGEHIVARSLSFFWFKRIYIGTRFDELSVRVQTAVLLHELAHCLGHHTEWRILAWPLALWLPKWQEFWADNFVNRCGYGPDLYGLLIKQTHSGPFHPSNWQRRQNLIHNEFFASPPSRVDPAAQVVLSHCWRNQLES